MEPIAPGIWKIRIGSPESISPLFYQTEKPRLDALVALPKTAACPVSEKSIHSLVRPRGTRVDISIADEGQTEQFFGLGLQLKRVNQTGRRKMLRVNSDPVADTGDSHAPVPFFVSTAGYGVYIDTARYVSVSLGASEQLDPAAAAAKPAETRTIATDTTQLYAAKQLNRRTATIMVPVAQGVDLYIFAGPTMQNAVQRYNLFSGGGCLPPMWGLGVWYRMDARSNQQQALATAKSFRTAGLPCDVLGLEPGWQTHAYSCSFVWNAELFADPAAMIAQLRSDGYHVNLWEHAFVHPTSPMYAPLQSRAGDYLVWNGLVPDLADPKARQIFTDHHHDTFLAQGITGFKLDECDNSDFIEQSSWSFPECSQFPSGLDGEQMHSLFGTLYQQAIYRAFEQDNVRTYSSVRAAWALAAPYPFVLYSDLYDHRDFVRGVVVSGFSGLLWTPEVRHAESVDDLLRRIQSVVLSPQALINAWYIKNPPWMQFDREKNNADVFLPEAPAIEAAVRELFRLRMSLVPYLYAAFAKYAEDGTPPFRALPMDYPADAATHNLDDQYLIGPDLLAAAVFAGQTERTIYLPTGDWYDFQTHTRYAGGQKHTIALKPDSLMLFVRSGAILPLAEPVDSVRPETVFELTVHTYGPAAALRPAMLHEDDGVSFNYRKGQFNRVILKADRTIDRQGTFTPQRYRVREWQAIG